MKKLFMTRSCVVAYLIKMRRATPDDIDGLRVSQADLKMQNVEEVERLILDVRAGRTTQFSASFPDAIEIFITDP